MKNANRRRRRILGWRFRPAKSLDPARLRRGPSRLSPASPTWLVLGIVLSIGIAWGGAVGAGAEEKGGAAARREAAMRDALCGLAEASDAAAETCLRCLAQPSACRELPSRLRAIDARIARIERLSAEYAVAIDAQDTIDPIDAGACGDRWFDAEERLAECMLVALIVPPEAAEPNAALKP